MADSIENALAVEIDHYEIVLRTENARLGAMYDGPQKEQVLRTVSDCSAKIADLKTKLRKFK